MISNYIKIIKSTNLISQVFLNFSDRINIIFLTAIRTKLSHTDNINTQADSLNLLLFIYSHIHKKSVGIYLLLVPPSEALASP